MAIIESGVNLEDRIKDLEVRNAVANLRNAATSSLAKYDLADQVIDDFQTAAGLHTAFSIVLLIQLGILKELRLLIQTQ